ncbi:MAG: hypothetical protein M1813_004186 [Trichoglossum hirsutum]|nr:MAG: hypothetical protein M1813_004186 [Trichoglossum hirsutum]
MSYLAVHPSITNRGITNKFIPIPIGPQWPKRAIDIKRDIQRLLRAPAPILSAPIKIVAAGSTRLKLQRRPADGDFTLECGRPGVALEDSSILSVAFPYFGGHGKEPVVVSVAVEGAGGSEARHEVEVGEGGGGKEEEEEGSEGAEYSHV